MVMQTILLIAGVACLIAALVLVLWPRWVAAVPAYVGLWLMHWSYYIAVPTLTFIFWGIATFITVGLFYLSPSGEPDGHSSSNLYVGFTAMAGGMLGILLAPRLMVLGVVLGAAFGQLAYSRTPVDAQPLHSVCALFRRQVPARHRRRRHCVYCRHGNSN